MPLITLDQIYLPLRYTSGSGVMEFITDNSKGANFTELIIHGTTTSSGSVYIVDSGSLEGNPVDGGSF